MGGAPRCGDSFLEFSLRFSRLCWAFVPGSPGPAEAASSSTSLAVGLGRPRAFRRGEHTEEERREDQAARGKGTAVPGKEGNVVGAGAQPEAGAERVRLARGMRRARGPPGALGLGPWGGLSELLGALATRARREGRGAGPWAPRQACCPVGVWLFFPPPRPPSRPSLLGPWLKPPAGPPPHPPCVWVWMGCSEAAKLGCGPQPVQGDRAGERGPCEVRWPGR